MKNLKNYIQNLRLRTFFLFYVICMINVMFANSSKHLFNSAIDFRIGPEVPQPQDYAYIEQTKFKLCQFWIQHGQSLDLGIGLYSSGQIHIDTQGYRTWGPDLTRNSSMCNF